jgi:hypothetical protein
VVAPERELEDVKVLIHTPFALRDLVQDVMRLAQLTVVSLMSTVERLSA